MGVEIPKRVCLGTDCEPLGDNLDRTYPNDDAGRVEEIIRIMGICRQSEGCRVENAPRELPAANTSSMSPVVIR